MPWRTRTWLLLVPLLAGLVAASPQAPPETTSPSGAITFLARNTFVEADGSFHRWRVTKAEVDRAEPAASFIELEIDVASIDTGIERRDQHLRSEDFFEVETWPHATVRVHDARPDGQSERGNPRYAAKFDIRIRDVEKTLAGSFELIDDARVEGSLTLDRTDFAVGSPRSRWNPLSVHDEVVVRYTATLPTP